MILEIFLKIGKKLNIYLKRLSQMPYFHMCETICYRQKINFVFINILFDFSMVHLMSTLLSTLLWWPILYKTYVWPNWGIYSISLLQFVMGPWGVKYYFLTFLDYFTNFDGNTHHWHLLCTLLPTIINSK